MSRTALRKFDGVCYFKIMNTFNLSRNFFNWCFENPGKINTNHVAIYFFCVDLNNKLGWKEEFGLASYHCMEAIGINKHQTFIKYLNDLIDYGFIKLVQKAKNQYVSNIISLQSAMPKNGKALDRANMWHEVKHEVKHARDKVAIDKQVNNQTIKPINNNKHNIYQLAVDYWLKLHVNYIFNGMSGKHLKQLLDKIKTLLEKTNNDTSDQSILSMFELIINNLPDWFKDKDLPVINSKFNEIIEQIKNSKNEKSKPSSKFR